MDNNIRNIKGEKMLRILEIVDKGATRFVDLTAVYLTTPKGQQHTVKKRLREIERAREKEQFKNNELKRLKSLMAKMKYEGLIDTKNSSWSLTDLGEVKLRFLKDLLRRKGGYPKAKDDLVKIVAFDVPEKLRKYRDWLRFTLKTLGFTMLQKSVWLGKTKIPQELLIDLNNFGLIDYVEIIGITKSGTLKEIV